MTKATMRQRRKGSRAADGARRCAFFSLFTFVSFLETQVVPRNAFAAARAAATVAPARRGNFEFMHRKGAPSTNRGLQVKLAVGPDSSAAVTESEAAVAPQLVPPPPAGAAKTTTCHVVVASFGEPEPYHAVSLYFASRLAGATVHHVIMHTYGKGHEPGELNLKIAREEEKADGAAEGGGQASDHYQQQPSPFVPWRTVYRRLRVRRHNIDLSIEESYHALARSYLHSSAREVDYELLCFARFIGLYHFCTERGVDELTFLDADVIVFDRDFLTKVRIPANHSLWTVHGRSSFLATMTCSSVGDFVDYMLAFYQQRDRRKIVSTIEANGDDEIDPTKLKRLRDREPAFEALGVKPKLFSDMYVFERFLHDQFAHWLMSEKGGEGHFFGRAKENSSEVAKTPQATTLPLKFKEIKQGGEGPAWARGAAVDDDSTNNTTTSSTSSTTNTVPPLLLPPSVHYWNSSVEKYNNYFTLMVNMRYVTPVPHTRAWLCLNQTIFNAHFKINITSQLARMSGASGVPDGGEGSFEPFSGAHFQGDCKSKMMQLLYGDVIKAIEKMSDVQ